MPRNMADTPCKRTGLIPHSACEKGKSLRDLRRASRSSWECGFAETQCRAWFLLGLTAGRTRPHKPGTSRHAGGTGRPTQAHRLSDCDPGAEPVVQVGRPGV